MGRPAGELKRLEDEYLNDESIPETTKKFIAMVILFKALKLYRETGSSTYTKIIAWGSFVRLTCNDALNNDSSRSVHFVLKDEAKLSDKDKLSAKDRRLDMICKEWFELKPSGNGVPRLVLTKKYQDAKFEPKYRLGRKHYIFLNSRKDLYL